MEGEMQKAQRIVIVSNRLPVRLIRSGDNWQVRKTAGGLATAMRPVMKRSNGIWIGWSGDSSSVDDQKRRRLVEELAKEKSYYVVDLDSATAEGFYEGMSNEVLWPLFHHFPSLMRFDSGNWQAYVRANKIFCDEILRHLRPNDLIWIHDYHFLLLPQMLREAVADISIGFFLHIPFPSSSVFRILPKREALLRGMLGADYLAFHTHRYLQNFRTSVLRLLGLSSQMDSIDVGKRAVTLEALPIGIAPNEFNDALLRNEGTRSQFAELKKRFNYQKVILGVDRLDYTKGIPERLRAYKRFLEQHPEWRGRVVLIQVAVPTRERVAKYRSLRRQVDELIGEINGEWSTPNWSPITYVRRNLPQSELAALYALADVAFVTPLRDGLNLVAKEYVACKSSGDGVLILSEFAGATAEMGEALIVNPYDEEAVGATLQRALTLDESQRRERMMAMYQRVNKNNVFAWGERFVDRLNDAIKSRSARRQGDAVSLPTKDLLKSFIEAKSRLILLDYDGTLVPYTTLPQDAVPDRGLLRLLSRLSQDRQTSAAVVSGRSQAQLQEWFGRTAGLWLAAEHGSVLRCPESGKWQNAHPGESSEWKSRLFPILEHFVDRTPGSFIEEKEFSLVWHYRMAEPEFGDWLANDLVANLEQMLADTPAKAVKGQKNVEIKLIWADKGQIYRRLIQEGNDPEFILAAGDDATDEDLFAQLPRHAWTIHVGRGLSQAKYYLADSRDVRELIALLVDVLAGDTPNHENNPKHPGDLPSPSLHERIISNRRASISEVNRFAGAHD
jgi:trehalose 6-phosphate synthase/phosphatase